MYQDLSLDGSSRLLLVDMLLEINIKRLILQWVSLELLRLFSKGKVGKSSVWRYINLKEKEELDWQCIIQMKVSRNSQIVALNTPYSENILYTSQLKTRFLRNMMDVLKILSKEFIRKNTNNFSKHKRYGMSIV